MQPLLLLLLSELLSAAAAALRRAVPLYRHHKAAQQSAFVSCYHARAAKVLHHSMLKLRTAGAAAMELLGGVGG